MAPPKKRSKISEEPAETNLPVADANYGLNDMVYCKYGPKSYQAKIISITNKNGQPAYEVHYQGWNKRYDEVITEQEAKDRFSKNAPIKEDSKKPSSSAKSDRKPKTNGRVSTSELETKNVAFDSLINEDLAFVLCEENEKITKNQLVPIVPAKVNIEQIIVKFLESKSIAVNDQSFFEKSENIVPRKSDTEEVMASFLTLFNHVFSRLLIYEEEKELFNNFPKEENAGNSSYHRYSKSLGLTYLIRFISRLPSVIVNNSIWNEEAVKHFNKSTSELSSFLIENIDNFYSEDEYYKKSATRQ